MNSLKQPHKYILFFTVVFCCILMTIVDGIIKPDYIIKSSVKLVLFCICPIIYSCCVADVSLKKLFSISKKGLIHSFFLGFGVYSVILGAYFFLNNVVDFSNITNTLSADIGVNVENFVWVALYISIANSLLEEFFFRGFAFLSLKKFVSRKTAYLFSAVSFALYHVAMMLSWFSVGIFIIILIGLAIGGLLFNYLNEKNENIYTSWIVHMFANFAINTVGFILFGII